MCSMYDDVTWYVSVKSNLLGVADLNTCMYLHIHICTYGEKRKKKKEKKGKKKKK